VKKLSVSLSFFLLYLFLTTPASWAQNAGKDTNPFRGKTISLIVATNAGGSYDQYGRLIASALEQKLQARVNVKYVTGEGMINGANEIYLAPPDGLTLGTFNIGLMVAQLRQEKGIRFDLKKFTWLGNAAAMARFLSIRTSLPHKNIEDLKNSKEAIKIPSSGVGSSAHNDVLMIKKILGINIEIVPGYGGAATDKAIASGEMDGRMGSSSSLIPYFQKGQLRPVLVIAEKRDPAYPDVPTLFEIAPKETQPLVRLMVTMSEIARPFAAPPGLPEETAKPLRRAFEDAFSDPAILDLAKKGKLPMHYYGPSQVQKMVADALNQPPGVVDFLKTLVISE
jgi:tripartite-type tricarboxylate transporter receptor subunit TctC